MGHQGGYMVSPVPWGQGMEWTSVFLAGFFGWGWRRMERNSRRHGKHACCKGVWRHAPPPPPPPPPPEMTALRLNPVDFANTCVQNQRLCSRLLYVDSNRHFLVKDNYDIMHPFLNSGGGGRSQSVAVLQVAEK